MNPELEELEALAAALRTSGITADDCRAVETLYAVAGHSGSHRIVQAMRYLRTWIERRPRILAKWPECDQNVARVGQNHKGDRAMMSEELEAITRRAIACKHWRWMPGMLTTENLRIIETTPALVVSDGRSTTHFRTRMCLTWPNLRDPSTLLCLLMLVREAHDDTKMFAETYSFLRNSWRDTNVFFSKSWDATTEAAALVAALEGAP